MRNEVVVIGIGLMFIAYGLGYVLGYRHCFDYIQEEFRRYRENKDGGDNTD